MRGGRRAGCPWAGDRAGNVGHRTVLTWEAARAPSTETSRLLGTQSALRGGDGLKPLAQSSECFVSKHSPTQKELLWERDRQSGRERRGESSRVPPVAHLLTGGFGQHQVEVVVADAGPGSRLSVQHLQDGSVFGNTGWRQTQSELCRRRRLAAAACPLRSASRVSCTHPRVVVPQGPTGDSWPRPPPADSPPARRTPAAAAPASGAACRRSSGSPGKP